jgi:DDE superfamily endonuclease
MNQIIPSLARLLAPIAPAFRQEVFPMFCLMTTAWIVCLGRRTISRVWETTGQTHQRHHSAAFRLFSQAKWNFDEVIRLHLVQILQVFVPGMRVWLVVDDTLCHKRGAKVAFGGIFLDAVLSTKKHKIFRYGNNWVLLGLIVSLPGRWDRSFCIPLLWRVFQKQGSKSKKEHRTKPMLAAEMIRTVASWLPKYEIWVVADSAYIGKTLLHDRPKNVHVLGPICWHAALTEVLAGEVMASEQTAKRLPTPRARMNQENGWKVRIFEWIHGSKRRLEVQSFLARWETVAGSSAVRVVLLRDPKREWREEALVSTNPKLSEWEMVMGYCQRWSVEVAIGDAKGMLGFHDPCVWKAESVERAAPMAWYSGMLVLLWYALEGESHRVAVRHRPWYPKEGVTFSEMLFCFRLALWEHWWAERGDKSPAAMPPEEWLLEYLATAA